MKDNFKKAQDFIIKEAAKLNACNSEVEKIKEAKDINTLVEVIRYNAGWVRRTNLFTDKKAISLFGVTISNLLNSGDLNSGYLNSGDLNSGYRNSGDLNSGYRNSGNRNSGYLNSGYLNSGDRNSGNQNSGDRNSGNLNSGDLNSGDRNSGNLNSGDRNSGNLNSGNQNSGDLNSGNQNSGDLNSGDLNSGYLNSTTPTLINVMNKPCKMEDWNACIKPNFFWELLLTEWVRWDDMSDQEKKDYPNAYTCEGYLKRHDYKDAWTTAYKKATKKDIELLKALPNWDAKVFEEITGIKVKSN